MRPFAALTICIFTGWLLAAPTQKSKQSDETVDWLFGKATTVPTSRPSTHPSSAPISPFVEKSNPESRRGVLILNTGEKISGQIWTTREKPLRLWDEKDKEYRDIPLAAIKSLEAIIVWERDEKEWHFKEGGSDIKEFSGKTYPARELQYRLTLQNGQTLTGGLVARVYISTADKSLTFILNKRQKGDVGKALKDLIYVKRVEFDN
ncbi:MAG TPA: hypothetical protein VGQ99_06595 [Tepidisphaeraceae bacterium]|jgi:hypothetical protein|nr:hypothetical protein [Tepidisphaeraceae bacterium]